MEPRLRAIIDLVWRVRMVSTDLVAGLYYQAPERGLDEAASLAAEDLLDLAKEDFLHRWYPPKKIHGHRDRQPLWFLGRNAAPYLEGRYGGKVGPEAYVTRPEQVGILSLSHDLTANRLLGMLRDQALADGGRTRDAHVGLDLPAGNWYGPRHLALSYPDQINHTRRLMIPDGFACAAATTSQPREGYPSTWLTPFFLEYDRGSRTYPEVIDQLVGYHSLALSRAAALRFPQFDVEGYSVPVIMVFGIASRVKTIGKALRERMADLGISRPSPILLVAQKDLESGGWNEPVAAYAWDPKPERRWPLYALLERVSDPLIQSRRLGAHAILRIDRKAAARPPETNPHQQAKARAERERRAALPAAVVSTPEHGPGPVQPGDEAASAA